MSLGKMMGGAVKGVGSLFGGGKKAPSRGMIPGVGMGRPMGPPLVAMQGPMDPNMPPAPDVATGGAPGISPILMQRMMAMRGGVR